ncbi:hypothetical protein AMTRI_Chr09g42490 [Amborella trichopoda]
MIMAGLSSPNMDKSLLNLLLILSMALGFLAANAQDKKNYIVYMGDLPDSNFNTMSASMMQHNALADVTGSLAVAEQSMVRSYSNSFNAFVAKLTPDEAKKLSSKEGVLSVFPSGYRQLHTTRSWDFIGFSQSANRNLKSESQIIVGVLDTGITPDSESFSDKGFSPPPTKWKGSCGPFANFSCNNKLIGAKYFRAQGEALDPSEIESPIDVVGHGTHTASTVAGNSVEGANLYGLAEGTARGGVPSARIAAYKICWNNAGCSDMDILAGFDAAIGDGVDIISLSVGGPSTSYLTDVIAIGSFHAMKKGILTACSAGNDGPMPETVENYAPWIFTIAASSIDRQFRSKLMLGDGQEFSGLALNTFPSMKSFYPLITGSSATDPSASDNIQFSKNCILGSLLPKKIKGKIVFCESSSDATIKALAGVGTIVSADDSLDVALMFADPGTTVNHSHSDLILKYINSTKAPKAQLLKSDTLRMDDAPFIASFSSRGPKPVSPRILKPDIAAPGLDILAAYSPLAPVDRDSPDGRVAKFIIFSGTSMACPHAAGAAAYVKSFRPTWSPAAIKSAIMTTATPMNASKSHDAEFAYGAGQINPTKALNPGLIYDLDKMAYLQFLCQEGYDGSMLSIIAGNNGEKLPPCSKMHKPKGGDGLNYPSMQLTLNNTNPFSTVFRRRVTNVDSKGSVYTASVHAPAGLAIVVKPNKLVFTKSLEKKSFKVVVRGNLPVNITMLSASLVWSDTVHSVRSPIVVHLA